MAGSFKVRALGKGSVASLVRGGLEVAWWLFWIGAAGWLLAVISYVAILILVANGVMDAGILHNQQTSLPIGDGTHGKITIDADDPAGITWPVAVPGLMAAGIMLGGGLVIIRRLKLLFATFTSGDPFKRENALHLRAIWMALAVVEIAREAMHGVTRALLATFEPEIARQSAYNFSFNLSTWAAILILIVLAEVFREGARMREEQELTI